jgi:hypothetical protein
VTVANTAAELVAQQHEAPGEAHLVILAGVAVAALVIVGVSRWQRRRSQAADRHSSSHDRSEETTHSQEPK